MAAVPAPDELEDIHAILAPILRDETARARRARVLAEDDRPEDDLRRGLADLDALIDQLVGQLRGDRPRPRRAGGLAPVEAPALPEPASPEAGPRAPTAADALAEMPPLPVRDAPPVDLERFDALDAEMPPLPDPITRPRVRDKKTEPSPPPVPKRVDAPTIVPPGAADSRAVRLLYEDIAFLYSIKDWGGMLISTERMLVMSRLDGQVKEFVESNEELLLNLYESYLGPFSKIPRVAGHSIDNAMPAAYQRAEKLSTLLGLIDGERSMSDLFQLSPYSRLETCSAINQLRRSGVITL